MQKTVLAFVIAFALAFCGCELNTAETSSDPPIPMPENPTVLWTGGALYEYVGEYMPGDYDPGGRNYIEIPENERWEKEFPLFGNTYTMQCCLRFENEDPAINEVYAYELRENKSTDFAINWDPERNMIIKFYLLGWPSDVKRSEAITIEEAEKRCLAFLKEQTNSSDGWEKTYEYTNFAYTDTDDIRNYDFKFQQKKKDVVIKEINIYTDGYGNIFRYKWFVYNEDSVNVPEWPEEFYLNIAEEKLRTEYEDIRSVAELKDIHIDRVRYVYIADYGKSAIDLVTHYTLVFHDDRPEQTVRTRIDILLETDSY